MPDTIAVDPGARVAPPSNSAEMLDGPEAVGATTAGAAIADVWPLTTKAVPEGARDTVLSPTVIAGPPALSVCDPTTNCEAVSAVMVLPATVICAGGLMLAGEGCTVTAPLPVPTTTAPAEAALTA